VHITTSETKSHREKLHSMFTQRSLGWGTLQESMDITGKNLYSSLQKLGRVGTEGDFLRDYPHLLDMFQRGAI
jgi:hypothetical protein